MNIFKKVAGFLSIMVLMSSCMNQKNQRDSDALNDEVTKEKLEARVERTARIKEKLRKIEENLAPIDSAFRDIGRIIKAKSSETENELRSLGISELRESLKQLADTLGIDQENESEDGKSYSVVRKLKMPVTISTRAGEITCSALSVKMIFTEKGDSGDSLKNSFSSELFIKPCGETEFLPLAEIEGSVEGGVFVKFDSQSLRSLPESQVSLDRCNLRIEPKTSESELNCGEFSVNAFQTKLQFKPLHFLKSKDGVVLNLNVEAFKESSEESLIQISMTQSMGEKSPTTRIKTKNSETEEK